MSANGPGNSGVALWKATDFTPLGSFPTSDQIMRLCCDGMDFWLARDREFATDRLLRF